MPRVRVKPNLNDPDASPTITFDDDKASLSSRGTMSTVQDVIFGDRRSETSTPIAIAIRARQLDSNRSNKPIYLLGALSATGLILALLSAVEYFREEVDIVPPFDNKDSADTACGIAFGAGLSIGSFIGCYLLFKNFQKEQAESPKAIQDVYGTFTQPN
ncbi:MAG: hypothetical protein K0S29_1088 [Gammaproteobacteria bacterium]|jgi:hypothetical protein|nr:hypothetical protein [Gammaproteobacteria bacterium]